VLQGGLPLRTAKGQIRQRIEHLRILDDPSLITPIRFGEREGTCYIVQDYFDGVPLDRLIKERSAVPLNDFLVIACKLAQRAGEGP
jgi:serine/threonine protein kinase